MRKKGSVVLVVLLVFAFLSANVSAADLSVYKSDDSYDVKIDEMDGTGFILKHDYKFDVTTEDGTPVDVCYALWVDSNNDAEPYIEITAYAGGISAFDTAIFKTAKNRYTFNLSNVQANLTSDQSGLYVIVYLFDKQAMDMLRDFGESEEPIQFRLICTGSSNTTINGTLQPQNREDVIDFCNDYEAAGGYDQRLMEKYTDSKNYACDVVNLEGGESVNNDVPENISDNTPVDVSYDDKLVIAVVQQALIDAGFDSGKADGVVGTKTTSAISGYQSAMGLEATGTITDELVESLGITDGVQKAARKEASKPEYSADIPYDQLLRNPDSFKGMKFVRSGVVVGDYNEGGGRRELILAIDSDYDQILYVFYPSDLISYNLLKGDQVTIYGQSEGLYSYNTTGGNTLTVPSFTADIIEIHN